MSNHLVEVLKPALVLSTQEPERAFNRLELMIALEGLDRMEDPLARGYFLAWRFTWRHEDAAYTEVFAEAEEPGDQWPPLGAGMFGGSAERFRKVREGFGAKLAK